MIARKHWAAALLAMLTLAALAPSCSGDDDNGNSSSSCTVSGDSCDLGCSATLGCVECSTNADCSDGAPVCVLGTCGECAVSADCATGQACEPATHQCETACTADADCVDNDNNDDTTLCDTTTGACVGCLTSDTCPTEAPLCDPNRQQCSQCVTRADCGVAAPACNQQTGQCEECLVDSDCDSGSGCNANHTCQLYCTSNDNCVANANDQYLGFGDVCNTTTGACVGCATNADCTETAAPVCNEQGLCSACSVNTDCPTATPICATVTYENGPGQGQGQTTTQCVVCETNADCTDDALPVCSASYVCVGCTASSDCTDTALPVCDLETNTCVAEG